MPSLFSCFGGGGGSSGASGKALLLSTSSAPDEQQNGKPGSREVDAAATSKCVFCNITPERFNVVLEDKDYICFTDRSPAATEHLLVVPRQHIANVKSLTKEHAVMVEEMQRLGQRALEVRSPGGTEERRFGFHIPPFTSVDHLHLHALQLPFRSTLRSLKYRIAQPPSGTNSHTGREYHKGWSWFVEYRQACTILRDGGKVKVGAC